MKRQKTLQAKAKAKTAGRQDTAYSYSSDEDSDEDPLEIADTPKSFTGDDSQFVAAEDSEEFTEFYLNKHIGAFSAGKGTNRGLVAQYESNLTHFIQQNVNQMRLSRVQPALQWFVNKAKGMPPVCPAIGS